MSQTEGLKIAATSSLVSAAEQHSDSSFPRPPLPQLLSLLPLCRPFFCVLLALSWSSFISPALSSSSPPSLGSARLYYVCRVFPGGLLLAAVESSKTCSFPTSSATVSMWCNHSSPEPSDGSGSASAVKMASSKFSVFWFHTVLFCQSVKTEWMRTQLSDMQSESEATKESFSHLVLFERTQLCPLEVDPDKRDLVLYLLGRGLFLLCRTSSLFGGLRPSTTMDHVQNTEEHD